MKTQTEQLVKDFFDRRKDLAFMQEKIITAVQVLAYGCEGMSCWESAHPAMLKMLPQQ